MILNSNSSIKKKSILVIDDDPGCYLTVNLMLEKYYNIISADSGKTGIDIALTNLPDLILLDIAMPEMDGFETAKVLKENNETKGIPIIILTGRDNKDDLALAFDYGAVEYIIKPFSFEDIYPRVKTHIELSSYKNNLEVMLAIKTKELKDMNDSLISKNIALKEVLNSIVNCNGILIQSCNRKLIQ